MFLCIPIVIDGLTTDLQRFSKSALISPKLNGFNNKKASSSLVGKIDGFDPYVIIKKRNLFLIGLMKFEI